MDLDAERWRHFAQSPQTAMMLGSDLDPNSKQDWAAECNRLADAAMQSKTDKPGHVLYSKQESDIQDEPMFWSNEDGWSSLEGATVFSEEFPLDGLPLEPGAVMMSTAQASTLVTEFNNANPSYDPFPR